MGQVALVTGANKGIGLEVARKLGTAGLTVYLGARDEGRGRAAEEALKGEGLDVRFVRLDLADERSMLDAEAQIDRDFGRLDVLVNNAGIVQQGDGPPGEADLGAVKRTFDTNFFDTVRLTQIMLPLLKKSSAGRIVNVSSGLGSQTLHSLPESPFSGWGYLGYCASKTALNMFTILLAKELRESGILVNSADPGYTATDLNNHSGHQTVEEGAREAARLALLPAGGPTGTVSDMHGPKPW